jgi:adenylate kinase
LVPDKIVVDLVQHELKKPMFNKGYILDGFPRTKTQAEFYDDFLNERNESIYALILLEVPQRILIERILGLSEGRLDDKKEKVKKRLEIFLDQTLVVKEYYEPRGIVEEIDGIGSVEEIFGRIKNVLE